MRQLGRLAVWYPVDRLDGASIRRLLRTVEELGYSVLWYPEAIGYESLSIGGFMLANSTRLIIGSSIANIYARDPFTARRGLRTLSSLYDDRFILGLGVSHVPMVEGLRGHVYEKPVPAMCHYLDGVYEDPSNAAEWPLVIAALPEYVAVPTVACPITTGAPPNAFESRMRTCVPPVVMLAFSRTVRSATVTPGAASVLLAPQVVIQFEVLAPT